MKIKLIFIFFLIFNQSSLWGNKNYIDSLKYEIEHSKGIKKILSIYTLGLHYQNTSPTEAVYYLNKGLDFAQKQKNDTLIALGYNHIGYQKYLSGNYNESIKCLFKALKIWEKNGSGPQTIICLQYIGIVYNDLGVYEKAMASFEKALKLSEKHNHKYSAALSTMQIGAIYYGQLKYDNALVNFENALKKMEEIKDDQGIADALNNVALIYEIKNNFPEALKLHLRSLEIAKKLKDNKGIGVSYHNIGLVYKKLNLNDNAINYLDSAIVIAKMIANKSDLKEIYHTKSEVYAQMKQFEKAYKYHNLFSDYADSLQNEQLSSQFAEMSTKYDTEKKENEIKLLQKDKENQKSIYKLEQKRQNTILFSVLGSLTLLVLFSITIFKKWRRAKKQKDLIELKEIETEKQKNIIEKKNNEITRSLEYAVRIQSAILPSRNTISKYFENSFILYKPKDIVSGDFYWFESVEDKILFAACDCTGHGVPGALVSVLCYNALNRAVKEFKLIQPAQILDKTSNIFEEYFSHNKIEIHDGMDISMCSFDPKTRELQWAGANLPLWIINKNEINELVPNKQCIGYNDEVVPFINHTLKLEPDTTIYLFTDGFSDQFGSANNVKLKRKNFRKLILTNSELSSNLREKALNDFITDYKKDTEQTDDMLVIGIQL